MTDNSPDIPFQRRHRRTGRRPGPPLGSQNALMVKPVWPTRSVKTKRRPWPHPHNAQHPTRFACSKVGFA